MISEPTNEERADRIGCVMQSYCLALEERDFNNDQDDITDLLTDLMHFCQLNEYDFEESLRMARIHYEAEKETP